MGSVTFRRLSVSILLSFIIYHALKWKMSLYSVSFGYHLNDLKRDQEAASTVNLKPVLTDMLKIETSGINCLCMRTQKFLNAIN
jgi:hypothetical protein